MKRNKIIASTALAMGLAAGTTAVHTAPAEAWALSGSVTLQGTSHCGASATTWVWVEANNGERGWATNGSGRYKFNFTKIGRGGNTVKVNYGNSTFKCTDTFGVQRPATGTTATRNLWKLVPNG